MTTQYTAAHTSIRTAVIMVLFTVAFTAMMAYVYTLTREAIDASAQEEKMKLINEVLPAEAYDNALLDDYVQIGPTPDLGLDSGGRIYRARKAGAPAALVLEAAAPDGYSGHIDLIVAVGAEGRISGVRVVTHKETPGLGDYIDPRKDKDKARPWITRFDHLSFGDVSRAEWKVKKDGGRFDYHTGATISARAVTNAVGRVLAYAGAEHERLYTAASATAP